MAKYELRLNGDFEDLLAYFEQYILSASISATIENSSDYQTGDVRCAFRVYERYSIIGENRLSMSVVLVGKGEELFLSGITSGGSRAVLFKINTFGEEAFLDVLRNAISSYRKQQE